MDGMEGEWWWEYHRWPSWPFSNRCKELAALKEKPCRSHHRFPAFFALLDRLLVPRFVSCYEKGAIRKLHRDNPISEHDQTWGFGLKVSFQQRLLLTHR
jgi:hypothetical protein